jgi:hypothetical protein
MRRVPILIIAVLVAASLAGRAAAATGDITTSTSSNWAGYAVASSDATTPTTFTSVSGAWRAPAATCTPGEATYSAFWVGLGGDSDTSQALEQIGTESNCSAGGKASYDAWYELVPAASVPVKFVVKPGDSLSARVTVSGTSVTLSIKNTTRKTIFSKTLTMSSPDVSSAEWIAEAPSACTSNGNCRTLSLANFGTVTFASARATAAGHTATITDPAWAATAVSLAGGGGLGRGPGRFSSLAPAAVATPSALSADGGNFAVTWSESTT